MPEWSTHSCQHCRMVIRQCWQEWVNHGRIERKSSYRTRKTIAREGRAIIRLIFTAPDTTLWAIQCIIDTPLTVRTIHKWFGDNVLTPEVYCVNCLLLVHTNNNVWCDNCLVRPGTSLTRIEMLLVTNLALIWVQVTSEDVSEDVQDISGVLPCLSLITQLDIRELISGVSFRLIEELLWLSSVAARWYVDDIWRSVALPFILRQLKFTFQQDNARLTLQ